MKHLDDVELFNRIRMDDRLAFTELVNRYTNLLFYAVNNRIHCVEDAEEIIQDVFSSFWFKRKKLKFEGSIYPYLFKAIKYETIDWFIREQRKQIKLLEVQNHLFSEIQSNSTEDELIAKELAFYIEKEVDKMPKTMKTVYGLSRNNRMSIKEIATQLAISEQTVKNNISIVLNKLKLKFK